jgi:hypothetical protein
MPESFSIFKKTWELFHPNFHSSRGRVPALVTANLLGCIGGALSGVFYQNFIVFCILRFITGMAFDNSFTMIYILGKTCTLSISGYNLGLY